MQASVNGKHIHGSKRNGKTKGKEGAQAGGGYEGRHAEGYIPHLATISIGQHRKYTIEGSSATDKDYPINTKMVNRPLNICLTRCTELKLELKNK